MSNKKLIFYVFCVITIFANCRKKNVDNAIAGLRTIKLNFLHKVNNQNFVIGNSYTNLFGEVFTVNKFQYYISNITLLKTNGTRQESENNSYHLIDANNSTSQQFNFNVNYADYNVIQFTVGVDSTRNVSGAQTGALDPLNGMFWTWNSGYIMAKMEGSSLASTEPNGELLYHIGGYSGINNAIRNVILPLPNGAINTSVGGTCNINFTVNVNNWFSGIHNMKIADGALAMSVSDRTKKYADNYATMFAVTSVVNQ